MSPYGTIPPTNALASSNVALLPILMVRSNFVPTDEPLYHVPSSIAVSGTKCIERAVGTI